MSDFKGAEICEVELVTKHPNADALDIIKLKGKDYNCIVQIGRWKEGNYCVYIPEFAVVPDTILERVQLKGRLAGSKGNRVKAVKLRGAISQGLVLTLEEVMGSEKYEEMEFVGAAPGPGEDIAEWVGIFKYEPPIPTSMSGDVLNLFGHTQKYDIENIKNHPDVLQDGEMVCITEKIHGTFICIGYDFMMAENKELYNNSIIIHSKGLGAKGLAFKWNARNENLLYHRAFRSVEKEVMEVVKNFYSTGQSFWLCGEVFGTGVQDLNYGFKDPQVRFFDVFSLHEGNRHAFSVENKRNFFDGYNLPRVPVLYNGPFSQDVLEYYTEEYGEGREQVSEGTKNCNVREGIVITPHQERRDDTLGRVILKSINPKYLTRKNATEYN